MYVTELLNEEGIEGIILDLRSSIFYYKGYSFLIVDSRDWGYDLTMYKGKTIIKREKISYRSLDKYHFNFLINEQRKNQKMD